MEITATEQVEAASAEEAVRKAEAGDHVADVGQVGFECHEGNDWERATAQAVSVDAV